MYYFVNKGIPSKLYENMFQNSTINALSRGRYINLSQMHLIYYCIMTSYEFHYTKRKYHLNNKKFAE